MLRKIFALVLFTLAVLKLAAQPDTSILLSPRDSSNMLNEVRVNAYFSYQPLLMAPFTVNTIDSSLVHGNHGQSLLPVLNLGPGIRMEERSPGSYRLSIRGSLLRSPFGVRNVKVYFDEFAFTDASGNTYLNQVDIANINRLEVLRGPDASLFGANTGGVLRMQVFDLGRDTSYTQVGLSGGSYGFFREHVQTRQKLGKHIFSLSHSWQRSDGYRENSAMDRKTFTLSDEWFYTRRAKIKLLALYSDLQYLTPGGLTQEQWDENPRAARPGTAFSPGAIEQKAGVYNNTFYGGISHEIKITDRIRHVLAVFGSRTDFENPFISNYEERKENNAGLRTWIEFSNGPEKELRLKFYVGFEGQRGWYDIRNYGNNKGVRDSLQAAGNFTTQYTFGFTRLNLDYKKLSAEFSLSNNYNRYSFINSFFPEDGKTKRDFSPQLMPRMAVACKIIPALSWRVIVSRGYSPPTLAEINTADNMINTELQPEKGWNYETGFRLKTQNSRVYIDLAGFYFKLDNAIVRRTRENGTEYFVNAGGTTQAGAELQFDIIALKQRSTGFIRKLKLCRSYTFSYFKFDDYNDGTNDYSGHFITGVPMHSAITGAEAELAGNFYFFLQYQITSKIPLNDASTVKTDQSHLVQAKLTWTSTRLIRKCKTIFFFGADNVLNWKYSLGNDLNAFGGRYYNAAPGRNYFGGISVVF